MNGTRTHARRQGVEHAYAIRVVGDEYELIGAVIVPGDRHPIYSSIADKRWKTPDEVSAVIDELTAPR